MRMMAEDLVGTIFPDQVACAENLVGEREVPDHPLVAQTISDCLNEAMDIQGLERLLTDIESGGIRIVAQDLTEPSPLAREVLTARPYAYLDDAPLEERRTQAVMSRRWLDPASADEIGRLDEAAIARVREEAWPDAANPDELHDALVWLGFLTEAEADAREDWKEWLLGLQQSRRAALITAQEGVFWVPAERSGRSRQCTPTLSSSRLSRHLQVLTRLGSPMLPWSSSCAGGSKAKARRRLRSLPGHSAFPLSGSPLRSPRSKSKASPCRLLHARRERARMVRAAAARAHPSLHGEAAPRRDRACLRARLSAFPVRLAGRFTRRTARRQPSARRCDRATCWLRGAGCGMGRGDPARAYD